MLSFRVEHQNVHLTFFDTIFDCILMSNFSVLKRTAQYMRGRAVYSIQWLPGSHNVVTIPFKHRGTVCSVLIDFNISFSSLFSRSLTLHYYESVSLFCKSFHAMEYVNKSL